MHNTVCPEMPIVLAKLAPCAKAVTVGARAAGRSRTEAADHRRWNNGVFAAFGDNENIIDIGGLVDLDQRDQTRMPIA